jgi:hypothetical protein
MLERLIQLEEDIRYQEPARDGEAEFAYQPGSLPVLISAPHGAAHTRDGKHKPEDEFTAGLARLLGEQTGAHVLYARRRSATDPNVDRDAPYKQLLAEIAAAHSLRFVLDLHGTRDGWNCGIELGTARGASCSPDETSLIVSTLEEHGFRLASPDRLTRLRVDKFYTGAGTAHAERVIMFACRRLGLAAAQFELNAHLRIPQRKPDSSGTDKDFRGDPALIERTIEAFAELVRRVG